MFEESWSKSEVVFALTCIPEPVVSLLFLVEDLLLSGIIDFNEF